NSIEKSELMFPVPLLSTVQLTYRLSVVWRLPASTAPANVAPAVLETTILSDQPFGAEGVKLTSDVATTYVPVVVVVWFAFTVTVWLPGVVHPLTVLNDSV